MSKVNWYRSPASVHTLTSHSKPRRRNPKSYIDEGFHSTPPDISSSTHADTRLYKPVQPSISICVRIMADFAPNRNLPLLVRANPHTGTTDTTRTRSSSKASQNKLQRSAAQASQPIAATGVATPMGPLLRSIGSPDSTDDGWTLFPSADSLAGSASSPTSDNNHNDRRAATHTQSQAVGLELTATNIQLLNMINDTSAVNERLWRRDGHTQHSSLHIHLQATATQYSDGDKAEFLEPWVPGNVCSYDSDYFAMGAWVEADRTIISGPSGGRRP